MAVVKIIELVGSSKTSTDDAAKQALAQAEADGVDPGAPGVWEGILAVARG